MAESQKMNNAVLNVGGPLTHANAVSSGGGELVEFDTTGIGGPPSADFDEDIRAKRTFDVTTRILGADQAARDAFIAKFARGTRFSGKTTPSGVGQFYITGEDVDGTDFVVTSRNINHGGNEENSELSFTLTEAGPTPVI